MGSVLVFAEEPQAALPKRCGIKIYRYETSEAEGTSPCESIEKPALIVSPFCKQSPKILKLSVSDLKDLPELLLEAYQKMEMFVGMG